MCDNLLCDVFNNKINLETFLTWLSHKNDHDSCKHIEKFGCSQNEFVSYFLNYIFDVLETDKNGELLQKRTKKLETLNISKNENFQVEENESERLSIIDTPKRKNDLNQSYASPLSPLYNKQNYFTPKNNNRSTPRTTPCLGDFLISSSSKKKSKRGSNEIVVKSDEKSKTRIRRINPTNLVAKRFSQDENSFVFKNDDISDNSNEQHEVLPLVDELPKLLIRRCSSDNSSLGKTSPCNSRSEILPDFQKVTFKQSLDVSVSIYIYLLNNNLVLNLASEVYFLISVLVEKNYCSLNDSESNLHENVVQLSNRTLFKTIHNRVYFAANILQRQIQILKFLDRFTLNLFIENARVKKFVSDAFLTDLVRIRDEKLEKCFSPCVNSLPTNVCFNLDTDNRDNFPTAVSFQAFCKQRDMFCEILRIWEKNHLDIRWDFAVGLGGKIKALLNVHADPANLVHLARLFKAKLMVNLNNTQENCSLFSNVKSETMSQLNNRIAPKQSGCGINSVPSFVGYEEFYWEFLVLASNQTFNKHVSDAFASEIADLTNSKFISADLDCIESFTNTALRQSYTVCIKSSSVLAKFLGFLESLPYKCDSAQMSQNVVTCQVRIRSQFHPSINLNEILSNCMKNKCLLLTIPWMVNYIAMLDFVTVRLPYFEQIFHTLFDIYYNFSNGQIDETAFLIKLSLGWLFDLPHFPKEMYYQWLSQKLNKENHPNCDLKLQLSEELTKTMNLDNSKIVDQTVLYSCCPYLNDIKTILVNNSSKMINQSTTVKYVTLFPASKPSPDAANKRLQNQLEEAFFNGQPASIRKTVEFVSERIASTCVKEIFNEIVPSYKKIALKQLKDILNLFTMSGLTDEEYLSVVAIINDRTKKCAISSIQELQNQINDETNSIIELCIGPVIDFLLIKELSQVKDVCVKISERMCRERIQQWRDSNITTNIFMKDFDTEMKSFISSNYVNREPAEKTVFMLPTFGRDMVHNPNALSGFEMVDLIRSFSLDVVRSKSDLVTPEQLKRLLDSVDQCINERCDLNECILLSINTLLLDVLVLLIAHLPGFVNCDLLNRFCSIWKEYNFKSKNIFQSVISPRNLMFFNKSTHLSWKAFEDCIALLLNENFLTFEIFEEQAVNVYKSFKCDATRKSFLNCSLSIVNNFKGDYDFTTLLSVLSN